MVLVYSVLAVILMILLIWRFEGDKPSTHGSAAWLSIWTAYKRKLFEDNGLLVGDWIGATGLSTFYENIHAITFGSSGSWKGISAIVPNILSYPFIFLVDPGGENTAIASKHWKQRGYNFSCINVFEMFTEEPWDLPAQGFNPLDFIEVASPSFAADSLLFAEMLTPRTGAESGSSAYFKSAAESAKRAMIIHIKTSEPAERQNLSTLFEYMTCDAEAWTALLAAMKANPICGDMVSREAIKLERIQDQAPEEFSAVMSTIQDDLNFLADPLVREKLSESEVDFSILKGLAQGSEGGVISVVLPLEYIESHAAITRLALACAVLEMQRRPLAKSRVLFLIDEAAALGKILRFPNWLATLRKYNVVFWTIWQNVGQVVHLYGKNWQTIIGNCGMRQILSVGELETAEYTEKMLGRTTVSSTSTNPKGERSFTETARPLVMADELFRMRADRQVVLLDNYKPLKLQKIPYWKRPELVGRYHPNPYYQGPTSSVGLREEIAAVKTSITRALLWLMAPHPSAACLIGLIVLFWTFIGLAS